MSVKLILATGVRNYLEVIELPIASFPTTNPIQIAEPTGTEVSYNWVNGYSDTFTTGWKLEVLERESDQFPIAKAYAPLSVVATQTILINDCRMIKNQKIFLACTVANDEITQLGFVSNVFVDGVSLWYLSPSFTGAALNGLKSAKSGAASGPEGVKAKARNRYGTEKPFIFTYINDYDYNPSSISGRTHYAPPQGARASSEVYYDFSQGTVFKNEDGTYLEDRNDASLSTANLYVENYLKSHAEVLGTEIIEYGLMELGTQNGILFTLENGVNLYAEYLGTTETSVLRYTFSLRNNDNEIITFTDYDGNIRPAKWENFRVFKNDEQLAASGFEKLYLIKVPKTAAALEGDIILAGVIKRRVTSTQTPWYTFSVVGRGYTGAGSDSIANVLKLSTTSEEILDEETTVVAPTSVTPQAEDPPGSTDTETTGGGEAKYDQAGETENIILPEADEDVSIVGDNENDFARVYNPTTGEMRLLAQWMCDDNLIAVIKKYFTTDAMDFIVSYHAIPGVVSKAETATPVGIGTYQSQTVTMKKVTDDTIEMDYGYITIEKRWGSANDYAPHTNAQVYLPFIGFETVDVNLLMPTQSEKECKIYLKYIVNVLDGAVTACLYKIIGTGGVLKNQIIGEWAGNGLCKYPITSVQSTAGAQAVVGIGTGLITAGAIGAIGAGLNKIGSDISQKGGSAQDALLGQGFNPTDASDQIKYGAAWSAASNQVNFGNKLQSGVNSGISAGIGMSIPSAGQQISQIGKMSVSHGGGCQGRSGFQMGRVPYLIIERVKQCLPTEQIPLIGYPAHTFKAVAEATDANGYMRFSEIHISSAVTKNNTIATANEVALIERLLLGGVYK